MTECLLNRAKNGSPAQTGWGWFNLLTLLFSGKKINFDG